MEMTQHPAASAEHPLDAAARICGGRNLFSIALGVSSAAVGNWKMRGVPIGQCVAIERATSGAVTRRDLRPDDWRDIWPELAAPAAEPAPEQPATAVKEAACP